ncbi:MAG: TIGR03618 family F420-dependent PPOX class oxidoreductase [Halodesulfurarchaeum sp.]
MYFLTGHARISMAQIPESFLDLLQTDAFATLVTLMPDGMPHPTPVWIGYDSGDGRDRPWEVTGDPALLVNTAEGRTKHRNVQHDPRVGVTVMDPSDPYRYLSVQGRVKEITKRGAAAHIDALAARYMDVDRYPHHDDESGDRVLFRIEPVNVLTG